MTGAPRSPQRTWDEKDGRSPSNAFGVLIRACMTLLTLSYSRTMEGLRPVFFGPRTLGRTWGTHPTI